MLEQLASHAGFALGRREALALTPSSNAEAVAERQRETAEARLFLETGGVMEFGDAGDVSAEAQRAAKGGVLTGLELRAVAETLRAGRLARGAFLRRDKACPALAGLAGRIPDMDAREAAISRAIGVDGQVGDAASSTRCGSCDRRGASPTAGWRTRCSGWCGRTARDGCCRSRW